MANTLSVSQLLIEKTLFYFEQRNSFLAPDLSVRDYVEYFDHKRNGGFFSGNSVRTRLPNIFIPYQGWTIPAQGVQEAEAILSLQEPIGVGTSFQSDEAQQYIDLEGESYLDRVAEPIAKGIMAKTNSVVADAYMPEVYNYVGDPTSEITTIKPFFDAEAMLNALCAVDRGGFIDDAFCCIYPTVKASFSEAMMNKFTPSINTEIYHKGRMGVLCNMEVMTENAVPIHHSFTPTGPTGTPVVGTTSTNGNTIQITGLTPSTNGIIKANDLFSIANCQKVNPLIKRVLPYKAQFVVKPNPTGGVLLDGSYDSDGTGTVTVTVNPYDSRATVGGAVNPFQTINRAVTATDPIVFAGSHVANIVWLKPMLTLVFPPLKKLDKGAESVLHQDPDNKIWMRYAAQDFILDSKHTRRVDIRPGILWRGEQSIKILSKIPTGL